MRYHIVGIAGAGMSAIANLLLDQGHTVSGSDPAANRQTAALQQRGAMVFRGHQSGQIAGAEALIVTAAARPDNPELVAARAAGVPILSRADLWREWSAQRPVIAVAGTHGKTTTSAMIATALRAAGLPIGYLIGSDVPDLGGNAAWGDPVAPLVIEADEYDRVFLALKPDIAVVTNVEWDHPDIYPDAEVYEQAFATFIAAADPQRVVVCGDSLIADRLAPPVSIRYGIDDVLAQNPASCRLAPLDWTASGVRTVVGRTQFEVWRYDRRTFGARIAGSQQLRLPGAHNASNALAALAVAALLQVDLTRASVALAEFRGTARRFEHKGEAGGVLLIDDYAHHPTEVRATLAAARAAYPERRLVVYLQPHTFSRTNALLDEWPEALANADLLLVGDIYAARETGDPAALAAILAERAAAAGVNARHVGDTDAATTALIAAVQPGDLVLTLGAGDGDRVGMHMLECRM
ncbi:MAG: UDP-N-acetylmuramate--L-alanine ligase [Oscillochloris sp.]|nr:UDP-N-acetylmuramate--L-alanine ligase [Oscillochloris sp.]